MLLFLFAGEGPTIPGSDSDAGMAAMVVAVTSSAGA
jgi:hypothetical protein